MSGRKVSGRPAAKKGVARKATRSPAADPQAEPEVEWTERAVSDLEGIAEHIARDKPAAAPPWIAKILLAAKNAGASPHAGRRVPEVGRDDIREVFLKSYRIVYLVTARGVAVLTVFEGHRLFPGDVGVPGGDEARPRSASGAVSAPRPGSGSPAASRRGR